MVWPKNYKFTISFSFDVDVDSFWRQKLISAGSDPNDPVVISMGQYGANVGVFRILKLLEKYKIKATFFVPGEIAERYTSLILAIKMQGHEIAHHGYEHLDQYSLSPERQIEEIIKGKKALEQKISVTPLGYRSPGGLGINTLEALLNNGIIYDSSMMGDDMPYIYQIKNREIVEIPWKYVYDDFVFYGFNFFPSLDYRKASPVNPRTVTEIWKDEFDILYEEGLFMTIIGHPHLIGQPSRIKALENFIKYILTRDSVGIVTYKEIAEYVKNNEKNFKKV
ncbi:MAG: polysaccharide deacetylase family protein [Thermoplasmata archaeon]